MKRCFLTLFLFISLIHYGSGATTLIAHYSGGGNPTLSDLPVERKWNTSSNLTYVQAVGYDDDGIPVWSIYDPGTASTNTAGSTWANLNYTKGINASMTQSLLSQGWIMSGVLKVPDDVSAGESYNPSSNIWLGYIHADPNKVPDRWVYAFVFGKTADGQTKMGLHGSTFTLLLDPTYHEYSMIYDPLIGKVDVYVDGIFRTQYSGAASSGGGANGDSMIYWGDNGSQTLPQVARAAYYQSINLYLIPEPSKALLATLGFTFLAFRRSRKIH